MIKCGFHEANAILENEKCYALVAEPIVVTCWKMTEEDWDEFKRTGRIYLVARMLNNGTVPDCEITIKKPWE